MRKFFLIILILMGCGSNETASAASHYVRAGAGGSGNGSDWTNACTNFTSSCAPGSLIRGDTYYVAGGNYTTSVTFNTANSGTLVITIKGATAADHGTSTGWSAAYGVDVTQAAFTSGHFFPTSYWTFDGSVGPAAGASGNRVKANYGFAFDSAYPYPISIGSQTSTTTGYTFAHIYAKAPTTDVEKFFVRGSPNYLTMTNVYVGYCMLDGWQNVWWASGLGSNNNWIFEHSTSLNGSSTVANHGEDINNNNSAMTNTIVRFNVFEGRPAGTGVIVANNADLITPQIYGNVFKNMRAGNGLITGTGNAGSGTDKHIRGALVYNNTFMNTCSDCGLWIGNYTDNDGFAYNNLLYNIDASMSGQIVHDYNSFYQTTNTPTETHGQISSLTPMNSSKDLCPNCANAGTPVWNTATSDDAHLLIATTVGTTLASPYNVDPDGNTRGADGMWDRGAFEFLSGAGGTFYYVDGTNGNDLNDGSAGSPWLTITKADQVAVAGDTVRVLPGTYIDPNGQAISAAGNYGIFNPSHSGTAGNPITFISYPNKLEAIITSAKACATDPGFANINLLEQSEAVGIFQRSYIVIDGFKIIGRGAAHSSDHITFQNNEVTCGALSGPDRSLNVGLGFFNGGVSPIGDTATSFSILQNNYVHGMVQTQDPPSHNSSVIGIYFGSSNNTIQNNTADCDNGSGASAVANAYGTKGGGTNNNTWRLNVAQNCITTSTQGFFTIGSTNGSTPITGNLFYQNIGFNLSTMFVGGDQGSQSNFYYNNTFYSTLAAASGRDGFIVMGSVSKSCSSPLSNWGQSVYNNISKTVNTRSVRWTDYTCTNFPTPDAFNVGFILSDYNDFTALTQWGDIGNSGGSVYNSPWLTLAAFKANNATLDQHSIASDPLFVDTLTIPTGLKLQGGSPAVNAGRTGGVVGGTAINMGAYITGNETIGYNGASILTLGSASIQFLGNGSGTVTSNPAGINCSTGNTGNCSAVFTTGTTVTLTASPLTGSIWGGWSGACVSQSLTCNVTMSSTVNVLATFNGTVSNPPPAPGVTGPRSPVTRTPHSRTPHSRLAN